MVFAVGLAAVTIIAPPAAVVTQPMLTKMAAGAAGTVIGGGVGAAVGAGAPAVAAGVGAAAGAGGATVGSAIIGTSAGVTSGLLTGVSAAMGPPGWIMLGKSEYSWSCWKKIIHDDSEDEEGVPLSYIFEHDNVKKVCNHENHYIVENVWGEKFKIIFVELSNGQIAAHAE